MNKPVTKRHLMIEMAEFERRLRQSSGNQTEDDPLAELARLTSGQQDSVHRVAEPQGQSLTGARQAAKPSPEAQEPVAQEPDLLQSSGYGGVARLDFGSANEKIVSRHSLSVMIMAAIDIVVGMVGLGASIGYRRSEALDQNRQHGLVWQADKSRDREHVRLRSAATVRKSLVEAVWPLTNSGNGTRIQGRSKSRY